MHFDLASAPPLSEDKDLFPVEYQQQMRWGTYRPGTYFGVKGRHAASLLFGLAWGSIDGKLLRHSCQSGELQAFNWLEHDGERYGLQEIQDQELNVRLLTTFVKDAEHPDRIWHARIDAAPLTEPAKKRAVSFFVYFGVEAEGNFILEKLHADAAKWEQAEDGSWKGSVSLTGHDPVQGPFSTVVTFHVDKAEVNNIAPFGWRRMSAQIPSEPSKGVEQFKTGVWDAVAHLRKYLRKTDKSIVKVLPDQPPSDAANWWALQLLVSPSARPRIEVHVTFGEETTQLEGLDLLVQQASQEFRMRLDGAFPAKAPFDTEAHRTGAAAAVAGLLGGLGSFRGRLLARKEAGGEELERLPAAALFSGVPSRNFFPRGFLWDEGFHGMLIVRWQPRIFLDILAHWLELQQASGWVPREVPLGAEQEARVPWQFLPQDPGVANPPSLLLPLAWLVGVAARPASPVADALSKRAGLASALELQKLVVRFGSAALPRLAAWFAFLDRSQRSSHKSRCYKWAGRSAAHCLASGLDDYPRGLLVNEDECHLDLHVWMTLFASTISALCRELGANTLLVANHQAVCLSPDWLGRAKSLNRSLHEVFSPAGADAPLADFLGKQPVSKKGQVVVVPPWRTDGRCGPEFPSGGGAGECDPYGGGACCSPSGWCGGSPDFCECPGCVRSKKLEDRKELFSNARPSHSPHLGYVSLFPVLLGLLKWDHPRARQLLEALQPETAKKKTKGAGTLWSPHGVMSLASGDALFRKGEDYWRGKIWGNMNYLAISALGRHATLTSPATELAQRAYESLRKGFVDTVLAALRNQRFFFENFDPATGEGRGTGPFTGWTTLVVLVMSDELLVVDFPQLLGEDGGRLPGEL